MDAADPLVATLPAIARLALAYAPASAREPTLALLALDARLAGLIRNSGEPMLAQLRLAWWRESIDRPAEEWPQGEPLLAAMRSWQGDHGALRVLVDGWEALTTPPPLPAEAAEAFAQGRGEAAAALAAVLGCERDIEAARRLGRIWGLEDLVMRLGREDEREQARALALREAKRLPPVGRSLRPLRVLAGLARRRRQSGAETGAMSPGAVLQALRLGLLGL